MSERRFQKLLKITYGLVIFLLFVVILLSFLLNNQDSPENKRLCTTSSCIQAANMILHNMDASVDPCEDFYQFTCGNFIKTKRIPDDQSRIDVFDGLRDTLAFNVAELLAEPINTDKDMQAAVNAKRLYSSCMNEGALEEYGDQRVLDFVNKEFNGWALLQNAADAVMPSTKTTIEKLVRLKLYDSRPLFEIFVGPDPKSQVKSLIKIKQPIWLHNKQYYNDTKFMLTYKNVLLKFAQLLNATNRNLKQDIDRMIDLEKSLAFSTVQEDQKRNSSYKNMTLRELQRQLPDFEWKKFIVTGIFQDIEDTDVDENEQVVLEDWDYLVSASKIYSSNVKNNKRDIENLFIWNFIKERSQFFSRKIREAKQEIDRMFKGTKSTPPRSLTCSSMLLETMEFVVGRMYVSRFFDEKSKKLATEMVYNIRNEFVKILKEVDWMDAESRNAALEKADKMDIKIGYPDYIYNDTYLEELYKDYVFKDKEFFKNNLLLTKTYTYYQLADLRKERNRKDWISGPAIVNAFYNPSANQICFPAGILQAPFYNSMSPNYLNYGGIGSVIGHEITHGFDDKGRLYDKDGIYFADGTTGLWTNRTIENYKKRAECIENQYNGYVAKQINKTLNGKLTLGENIADNGGVKESYRAYQKWAEKHGPEPLLPGLEQYSPNQLFFINHGQIWCGKFRPEALLRRVLDAPHSPGEFRIVGPTSNSEEFAKVFKCKKGQRNNPVKKCSVW